MNKEILNYFKGDELAANVWQDKYKMDGEKTPDDMHHKMAKEFAKIEYDYIIAERDNFNNLDNKEFQCEIGKLSSYGKDLLLLNDEELSANELLDYLEEKIYSLFKNFKYIVPQGSIMSQLGNKTIGSLSNCFNGDVKVLTRTGWVRIKYLAGYYIEIMTKGGGWVIAPFKSYGNQHLDKVTLSNGIQEKILHATSNHRWAMFKKSKLETVSDIKTTKELIIGDVLYSTYGKGRSGYKLSSIGIAHGITYGDGHSVKGVNNCNNITLCSDSKFLGKYFPESYVSSDETNCEGGSDFYSGLPNFFRSLPDINENKSYLYGFLSGYFAADGHLDKNGSAMICSSKQIDIEIVQDICGVLGIGCTDITEQTVISNLTDKEHTMYKCFIHKNHLSEDFFLLEKHKIRYNNTDKEPSRWKVVKVQKTKLIEEVFCAEVPKTESFVIEGNILSMNCFVIGQPEDSYGGIMLKDEELVQLMKRRGGVGIDLSTLRPKGTSTSNAAKSSTGATSFMNRFSNSTREVAQNGRRGALMISMDVRHPDILDFIKSKRDLTKITGANISIKLNDEFMTAVRNDTDYFLKFPCNSEWFGGSLKEFPMDELVTWGNIQVRRIRAKKYWKEIIKSAHSVAEPGLMFWDKMVDYSPDGVYTQYKPITTNPCAEIAMQAYDACRLMAVNLFSFVDNPFEDDAVFNIEKFYMVNYQAMRLSDDLIDLEITHIKRIIKKIENDPEILLTKIREYELWKKILETAVSSRRTGLGFTGLGDALAALGLKYGSDDALNVVNAIMSTKMESELDCTIDLAVLRGTFKGWDSNLEFDLIASNELVGNNDFYKFINNKFPKQALKIFDYGRRNVSVSTVAPTGSVNTCGFI